MVHWNCYNQGGCNQDPELGQEAPEVEVACHICLMQISTGEQESGMVFCDCDTSCSTFIHIECFNDVPLKCEIHTFYIFLFIN